MTQAVEIPVRRKPPKRMSPSALALFQSCPKAFEYQYVLKEKGEDRPSPVLVVGNAVHKALQLFFGLAVEERSEEVLHQALRSVWPEHVTEGAFFDKDEEIDAGRDALALLSQFWETQDCRVRPRMREDWVSCALPNGLRVFGRVDRVDDVEGGIAVIDYKTGKRAVSESELPNTAAAKVYALAAQERFRLPVVELRLVYLALGKTVSWRPTPRELDQARTDLVELTDSVHATEVFEAKPGDACRFCAYGSICEDKDRVRLEDLVVRQEVGF